ncbi:arylamine N-acetyltransferase family protein [Streptomyces sp. NPDC002851]
MDTTPVLPPFTPARFKLDLDAYLARIGLPSGRPEPTVETLRRVHRAHLTAIPFENGDPVLGRAPSLTLPDLEAKLVRGRRGGYCFEQNTLLAAALEALGFRVTALAARVRKGAPAGAVRPRTHMTLRVDVPGSAQPYLADVGFGDISGLLEPIPLATGTETTAGPRRHRLVREPHHGPDDLWVLRAFTDGDWEDEYAFTGEPFELPDYEVMNWHVATHPRSPFSRRLTAQRTTEGFHLYLFRGRLVTTYDDGRREEREVHGNDATLRVLAADFGIELPEGTRLEGAMLEG